MVFFLRFFLPLFVSPLFFLPFFLFLLLASSTSGVPDVLDCTVLQYSVEALNYLIM